MRRGAERLLRHPEERSRAGHPYRKGPRRATDSPEPWTPRATEIYLISLSLAFPFGRSGQPITEKR